ncbi:MAG TPA: class I SAM-dependent RNA methyltransferase [Thermotogota bacterium]|nr:class I SAM-dependent RNA methyltransferase [Thermotogota bacterium]HRW92368.1 class I SAM-dependent RNA methyltransferase [Thermotogota bacterium]
MTTQLGVIATCTFGLESVAAHEVKQMGFSLQDASDGKIRLMATAQDIPRLNIGLRCAERVLVEIASFAAASFDELFDSIANLEWENWIRKSDRVEISRVRSKKSSLFSERTVQSVAHKAILTRLQKSYHLQQFPEKGPAIPIHVYLAKNQCTVAIDTSGEGLHRRGYRLQRGEAPLRETIAAGLLHHARWHEPIPLMDPFCGSGTIAIEAAMMAANKAPGMQRRFLSEGWNWIPGRSWKDARREAGDMEKKSDTPLFASDSSTEMVRYAIENARRAGVEDFIRFAQKPAETVKSDLHYGFVVTNPPFGKRLSDLEQARMVYKQMRHFHKDLPDWSFFILSPFLELPNDLGKQQDRKIKISDSGLETYLQFFWGPRPGKE